MYHYFHKKQHKAVSSIIEVDHLMRRLKHSSASFARGRRISCHVYSLHFTMGWPLSHPKIVTSPGGWSGRPSNMWLLRPTPPHMPNSISIGPAVLPQYIRVTNDKQTDHEVTKYRVQDSNLRLAAWT